MANFVRTVSNNLHFGSGYISSISTFTPPPSGNSKTYTKSLAPSVILYNTTPHSGVLGYQYFNNQDGLLLAAIKNPLDPSGDLVPDVDLNPVSSGVVNILTTNPSSFFVRRTIDISSSRASRLMMYLKLDTEETPTVLRDKRVVYNDNDNPISGVLTPVSGYPVDSKVAFRILANEQTVYTVTSSFEGYINTTLPATTTQVTFETYDTALPTLTAVDSGVLGSGTYFKQPNYTVLFNDLKIYIPNTPSIPILNNTRAGTYEFIEYNNSASLSIDKCNPSGIFENIIIGQIENGVPVDYFVVGDKFRQEAYPNLRPLNANRNLALRFATPNYNSVDFNSKVELLLEVEKIDTKDAEYFRSANLNDYSVNTFYHGTFDFIKMSCETSTSSFPTTVESVSTISGSNKQSVFVKGGLIVFDVTSAVKDAVIAGQESINIIIKYDIPDLGKEDKYKYVVYNVGNKALNKPRLRYTKRQNIPDVVCEIDEDDDDEQGSGDTGDDDDDDDDNGGLVDLL